MSEWGQCLLRGIYAIQTLQFTTGFGFGSVYDIQISRSRYNNFNGTGFYGDYQQTLLEPTDPLFQAIGKAWIEEQVTTKQAIWRPYYVFAVIP